jgi:hypothetical protein
MKLTVDYAFVECQMLYDVTSVVAHLGTTCSTAHRPLRHLRQKTQLLAFVRRQHGNHSYYAGLHENVSSII